MDVLDYWDKVTYEFLEAILVCDDCYARLSIEPWLLLYDVIFFDDDDEIIFFISAFKNLIAPF